MCQLKHSCQLCKIIMMLTSCCWAAAVDSGIYEPEGATWTSSKSCWCMLGHFLLGGSWAVIIWEHFFLVLASSKIGKLLFSVVTPIPPNNFGSRFWKKVFCQFKMFGDAIKYVYSQSFSLSFQPHTQCTEIQIPRTLSSTVLQKSCCQCYLLTLHFSCCWRSSQKQVD